MSSPNETDYAQIANGPSCELPTSSSSGTVGQSHHTWVGPHSNEREEILRTAKSIAIVGASANPERPSYGVAKYLLQSSDYRVYFVNPNADEILSHKAYPDLASLPEVPDIVDVFRKSSDIPAVIEDVIAIGDKTVWIQLGIWNQDAAIYAESKGLTVVMDRCLKIDHARFRGETS